MVTKSCLTLFVTPWTVAQPPLSMGFSRQEYWSRLPFSPPRDLPDLGMDPESPTLWADWFSSVAQSCQTLCSPMNCNTSDFLSITDCRSLLRLISIKSVMPSNHSILCRPLLFPPSVFPSIRVFPNELVSHQGAKLLELQLQHQSLQ